nr:MAG TPA: hypothetical protein [Caudoviricetes sp.]
MILHLQTKKDSFPASLRKTQYCRSAGSLQSSLLYHSAPLLPYFHSYFSKYRIQTLR